MRDDIEASIQRREQRAAQAPSVTYPPELPVSARVDDIAAALRDHQAIVVCGETGSGKTTQLPKILLDMGIGAAGIIGHTQPRRLAARSVASRIADELGVTLGGVVGSKVRFNDRTSPSTLVKLMTDGILLSEMQSDRDLEAYEAIIIDEAHERSLNIDLLLGCLKQIMTRRRDLKIVVTSATIDPDRFSRHLAGPDGPAPIIEVSGRTYPVEIRYRPPVGKDDQEADLDHLAALCDAVDELCAQGHGDILIFEPGEREIRDAAAALTRHARPGTEILPLYGRLAHHEQDRVFAPHHGRRIVIATNVAETSLTVPGIKYVIDGGTARISRYSARSKLQRLEIEPISRASARQRAGRCGRTSDGICIRLYDEGDHDARDEFTPPEILRSNLASVILHMKALRLGSIERFPFLEPPDARQIADGLEMLTELDALDSKGELTDIGRALSRLPVDPRLGRMLIEAERRAALAEVLVIVAALSVQDPRERPFEQREQADLAHEEFEHADSDFLALLNVWRFYQALDAKLGASRLRKACREKVLSYMRLREWRDIHRQLRLLLGAMGYHAQNQPADDDAIHQSLLVGLLDNLGTKRREGDYEGLRNQKFRLFPGTGIEGKPAWIMAAEIVRTSQVFARTCARIDPAWIEHAVGDRVKRSYNEPQWDARSGRIVAAERATYRGLELHRGRMVHYGPIDPVASREMFIRCALIDGELRPSPAFLEHNAKVIEQLRSVEAKLRAEGSLASDDAIFAFYDARLPEDIHNAPRFRRWLKAARRDNDRVLFMDRSDFAGDGVDLPEGLPDSSDALGVSLDITYTNEPGRSHDGARVDVLLHELPRLVAEAEPFLIPA